MENQAELFKTSDIKTSAYFLSEGVPLVKLIKDSPQRVIFCFRDPQKVKELLQKYLANKALINPRLFSENLDYLKGLLYQDCEI